MRRFSDMLLAVIVLAAMIFTAVPTVFAADANVTYSGNAGEFIFKPGTDYSLTDLFPNFKDVMPGQTLTQKVTLKNNADKKVKVKIYMRALGAHGGQSKESIDFLNELKINVSAATNPKFFNGMADEKDGLASWTLLGTLYSGGKVDLNVTLTVPTTLDNMFQNKIGKLDWQFMIEEYPIDDGTVVDEEIECPACGGKHFHIIEKRDVNGEDLLSYKCDECGYIIPKNCPACGGKVHVVRFVDEEGNVYYYYECIDECGYRTDPIPGTGDNLHLERWLIAGGVSAAVIVILLIVVIRKKKNDKSEEVEP